MYWAFAYSRVLLFFDTSFLQLGSGFGNTLKTPSNNTLIQIPYGIDLEYLTLNFSIWKKKRDRETEREEEEGRTRDCYRSSTDHWQEKVLKSKNEY